jgi:ABC-2 type transport system permease protein
MLHIDGGLFRAASGAARAQFALTMTSLDDLRILLSYPLFTLIFMAIISYSGREDLAPYSLVATFLMSTIGLAFLVAGEILVQERLQQTLELVVAAPAQYFVVLISRVAVITSLSVFGFIEAWIVVRLVFDVTVSVSHPWLLATVIIFTIISATFTALITVGVLCFGRTPRTIQNSLVFPIYILGGVLVPVELLPNWLEPFSNVLFVSWAAELMRDSLQPGTLEDIPFRLGMLLLVGLLGGLSGAILLRHMLGRLVREGTLSLT